MKLSRADLKRDEVVFAVVRHGIKREQGDIALMRFEQDLSITRRLQYQTEAGKLLQGLGNTVAREMAPGRGFIGLTRIDLFSGTNNYVFALTADGRQVGVTSYLRFTSDVVDQPPNRDRLRQRTFKQALTSAGFLYGIPRCSSPYCARAYANNLDEHDAKATEPCATCKAAFNKLFRRDVLF